MHVSFHYNAALNLHNKLVEAARESLSTRLLSRAGSAAVGDEIIGGMLDDY